MGLTFASDPRVSFAEFERVLLRYHSPAAPEAHALYAACVDAGIDTAVALAFFFHESRCGTAGINVTYDLRNWGSVRGPQVPGAAEIVPVPGNGNFAKYPTWTAGLADWCARINQKYIGEWGLETIEKAIPKYAPGDDGNKPLEYIAAVNKLVKDWIAEDQQPMSTTTGYADRTSLLPISTDEKPDQRSGDKLTSFQAVVVHETANENPGATAESHRRYWMPGGGGALISSVQFVTDSTESIQLIPIDEQASHAGDVTGNTTGVGIEICVNDRLRFPVACAKAAVIAAKVFRAEGKAPVDGVTLRKHGSYPGTTHKQCPLHLNKGDWEVTWAQFVTMVKQAYADLGGVDYPKLWGPAFVYNPTFGIETEWRRAAVTLGAATSDEHSDSAGMVTRHFANGYVRYDPKTNTVRSFFPRPS